MMAVGVPISILIYFVMLTQLDQDAIISGIVWCFIGVVVYYFCKKQHHGITEINIDELTANTPDPTPAEREAMDKDYRFWKQVTAAFFALSLLLYLIPSVF